MTVQQTRILTRLPAGQAAICPCTDDIDTTLGKLREWLRLVGYTALGPAFLTWDRHARRQLYQPIAHVFAPKHTHEIHIIERRELLMLSVSINVKARQYNLAGIYDYAREHQFEALTPPYVPILGNTPFEQRQVIGYLPVMPHATQILLARINPISRKIGWIRQTPPLGEQLPSNFVRTQVGRSIARWTMLVLIAITLIMPIYLLLWYYRWIQLFSIEEFTQLLVFGMMLLIGSSLVLWRGLTHARRHWNRFWQNTPIPPLLLIDFEVEFDE